MPNFRRFAAGALILALGAVPVLADFHAAVAASPADAPVASHGIMIEAAWARATPPGATVGAGYLRIVNKARTADRLIGVSAPVAKQVTLHESIMNGSIARMRPVPGGLVVPAGATVALAPGGYHLMFEGLKAPLVAGHRVAATLDFQKAGKITVDFVVRGMGAGAPGEMHMH